MNVPQFLAGWTSKPRMELLAVAAASYFMALFMIYPLVAQAVIKIICKDRSSVDDDCNSTQVSEEASNVLMYCYLAIDLPSFLLVGTYGTIADKRGRKTALLIPLFGAFAFALSVFVVAYFEPSHYFAILMMGSVISGITGSYGTFLMAIYSYFADITTSTPGQRPHLFSILEACIFIAEMLGPLLGGIWSNYSGFAWPVFCSVSLLFLDILFVHSMPETLPLEAPLRGRPLTFDPLKTFRDILLFNRLKPLTGHSPMCWVMLAYFLFFLTSMGGSTVSVLYQKHVFHWSPTIIGVASALSAFSLVVSMLCVPKLYEILIGRPLYDISWIFVGCAAWSVYYILYSFAPNTPMALSAVVVVLLCGPLNPRTRALLSNSVPADCQAQIFSALAALKTLATAVSPVFITVYVAGLNNGHPAMIYWVFAGLCAVAAACVLRVRLSQSHFDNLPDPDGQLRYMVIEDESVTAEDKRSLAHHLRTPFPAMISGCEESSGTYNLLYKQESLAYVSPCHDDFEDGPGQATAPSTPASSLSVP